MTLKAALYATVLTIGTLVGAPVQAASGAKLADVFKGVTYTQPKCFGREYSNAELAQRPQQTVEQIKAKFLKYSSDPKVNSAGLKIEVRLKGEEGMNYHAEFSCMDYQGAVHCGIDCDGGSITVAKFDSKSVMFKSSGFTIHGGCGENEVEKFLKAVKGGDDVFNLTALPQAFCTDASAAYDTGSK